MPTAEASRLLRSRSIAALNSAVSNGNVKEDNSAEATSPSFDLFDLVEPGDAEAVSMAVSAHEAVQKAHG